ncbi:hypothetical protein OH738_06900 [Streptomyces hirsutus]|uniref:Uncharacterized protein n=1 Tax=Streptomyces hirsutus TaxID=35620 RepID=A0ABZ1GVF5_9ACTN|nr:hypothetical protein [Streptomyces hirsutus]WSD10074.1 hypothetical protein OIE73_32995 [Streptomyces hirsutus]WTD16543.1 hypothetical protein OH738_06900 [Streptomyces hirsutus]WTD78668.1 hypothetical protein OHB56_35400 [Streptomyces sp. NBC_01635]
MPHPYVPLPASWEGTAMAVLALLIPPLMLGVLLMLGRYEDLLLPGVREQVPDGVPAPQDAGPGPAPRPPRTAA